MINPNEAAFASPSVPGVENGTWGLTKRELFAAMVMQGLFSDPARTGNLASYAEDAVTAADALIARLNATTPAAEPLIRRGAK